MDDDIFPCRTGDFSLPIPQWTRTRSTHIPVCDSEVDVQELICAFSKLTIKSAGEVHDRSVNPAPYVYPFTTATSPAPIQSFIQCSPEAPIRDRNKILVASDCSHAYLCEPLMSKNNFPDFDISKYSIAVSRRSVFSLKKFLPFPKRLPSTRRLDNSMTLPSQQFPPLLPPL